MLADMDRKPAPPDSAWQRFAHSRVRLQRRHYLMVTGAGVLAFVLGAFVAFHAGEAKGRALAAMPAVRHAAVHPVQHARHHMAALARHAAPEKLAAAASPLDRLAMLAQAGNAKAELLMGLRYLQAPAPDQPKAANWIRRAADQHEPLAQYWLGTLYEKGNGVAPDAAEAVRWYEAAAGQGNRKAMHALGVAYAEGLGTQKDYSEAARWFTKAAALGLVNSEFNLGVLYERGLGVPQSLLDAYKWYAVAAAQGDGESRNRVEALKTQLSADDLAAAERAAQNFQPQSIDPQANSEPTLASLDSESPARH
jgi:localization factor PodJL